MKTQTIHIKNMICQRCVKSVKDDLTNLGLNVSAVKLGQARFEENPKITLLQIKNVLQENGFDILESAEGKLIEEIKHLIIDNKTVQLLSNQFRTIAGKSAAEYQKMKNKNRKGFEKI